MLSNNEKINGGSMKLRWDFGHTAEPWTVIGTPPHLGPGECPSVFAHEGTLRVATVHGYLGEAIYNARLIAMAPRLLRLCVEEHIRLFGHPFIYDTKMPCCALGHVIMALDKRTPI